MKMIKMTRFITALLLSITMALFVGVGTEIATEGAVSALVAATVLFTGTVLLSIGTYKDRRSGNFAFAIYQEIWVDYIMQNLFKNSEFMVKCFDESDKVLAGRVVHIPQAGAKPTVVKNRAIGSTATNVTRVDTDITYNLDDYTTDPTLITDAEANEISYDKIGSVLDEHLQTLRETIGDDLLIKWLTGIPAANIIRTTGGAVATALAPGATGTRLKFLKADLKAAQNLFNKQNIPAEERYALFPTDLYSQLQEDSDLMQRDNALDMNLKDGVVGRLYGFNLIERSSTPVFTNASPPVVKALGAASATTDNMSVVCWQKNAVAKALGSVKFFEALNDPNSYGDIYSALVKMGGRARRTLFQGVAAIVQA